MTLEPPPARVQLDALVSRGDPGELQSALREVCGQFGKVVSLDVVTMAEAGKRHALSFLRLESQAQESALMASLGALRFGGEVLVVVDLPS
jgi:hypothetical protein